MGLLATFDKWAAKGSEQRAQVVTLSDLRIRTKDRRIVPFVPNAVQSQYLDMLCPGWRPDAPIPIRGRREIILKARQEGMSTLILALFFLDTINTPNTYSMIVAHDADSTTRLFQIIQRYYDTLPEEKRLPTKYSSRKELLFRDTDSGIYVATAGSRNIAHGATLQNIHLSEYSRWPTMDPLTGLLEALAHTGNAIIETTANGMDEFYSDYEAAKRGDTIWTPRFFGWNLHTEYRAPVPDGFTRTEEEAALVSAYGLDDEQLVWRRGKMSERRPGSPVFAEQYPINDVEAFLASAQDSVFPIDYLIWLLKQVQEEEPPEEVEGLVGTYLVWRDAVPKHEYVVVADPAEGKRSEKMGSDPDYSVAQVWDAQTYEQVASYYGRPSAPYFAGDLVAIAATYNDAEIMPENNGKAGGALGQQLVDVQQWPYLYYQEQIWEDADPDVNDPGFLATAASKRRLDDNLAGHLAEQEQYLSLRVGKPVARAPGLRIRHERTVEELMHYAELPSGSRGALPGFHDDEVTCTRMALEWLAHHTPKKDWKVRSYGSGSRFAPREARR